MRKRITEIDKHPVPEIMADVALIPRHRFRAYLLVLEDDPSEVFRIQTL
jgi:hypothetical protein